METKVKQVYEAELDKLVKRGILTEEQSQKAANQSNLNDMVEKAAETEKLKEAESAVKEGLPSASQSGSKPVKFAALAVILKRLGADKAQEILKAFDTEDAKHIINYMKMSGLENKISADVMLKSLSEIKKIIPESNYINVNRIIKIFHNAVKAAPEKTVNAIALNERENIRDFMLDRAFPAAETFSPYVLKSIAASIEEKLNDN